MKTTQADSYLKALEELLDYKAIYGDNPRKSVPRSK